MSYRPHRQNWLWRLRVACGLLIGLRWPDFQAAGTYIEQRFSNGGCVNRWWRFMGWALHQMFTVIPDAMRYLTIDRYVSRTPMWLCDPNPLSNYPWKNDPEAKLLQHCDTVVVGAGFTGAALAYHWAKHAPSERQMVVVEMDDAASGSAGRNEGLVVMGRYFKMVRDTVRAHLLNVRSDLSDEQREQLSGQFADRYCHAAYHNAELIAQTVEAERFDCNYVRAGWVQERDAGSQAALDESVALANAHGWTDWARIDPDEALDRSGMALDHPAGFSKAAASWHPAKWVWCLLDCALRSPTVSLFTRTRVSQVESSGNGYRIHTDRGVIEAQHIVYATESYTPRLFPRFHDVIMPMQEQAASGTGGPEAMKPHIGISGAWMFCGRYGRRVLFGSGGSRLPDQQAGRNRPSRFLTKFVASELKRLYGPYRLHMTNEWTGTVGYTPDEYPIVGRIDDHGAYIIAGMCGSGSGVSFNGGRCIVNRILGRNDEDDDYPEPYFAPSRLLDPAHHAWPELEPVHL